MIGSNGKDAAVTVTVTLHHYVNTDYVISISKYDIKINDPQQRNNTYMFHLVDVLCNIEFVM